jgi:hypothetical protein
MPSSQDISSFAMRTERSSLAPVGQRAGNVRWDLTTRDSVRHKTPGPLGPVLGAEVPLRRPLAEAAEGGPLNLLVRNNCWRSKVDGVSKV